MIMKPKVWAHRGAAGWDVQYAPENTLPAFQKAIDMGADGIELDVQLTKDGEIVVTHDEMINRVSDGTGWVKDYTLAELKNFNFNKTHPEFPFTAIPTLEEIYQLMSVNTLLINVELKTGVISYVGLEEKVAALTKKMHMEERVIYSSFNHYSVKKMQQLSPESKAGLLYADGFMDVPAYGKKMGVDALHPAMRNLRYPHFLEECRKENLAVHVWTVDYTIDIKKMCELGVDAFITNCPDRAKRIVDEYQG